ncbi:RNA-binding S4 domain-containing protein [Consotaella salsifontis]|uniref:Heat shock protein Hsp15 n=1 Tax=Consotaella salsifontis TaxID=1365950 RepID=A0A1T4SQF2_9HYPH|nr:RNA-binding S4 domain-containing protein [Consotaella salsifontis]SKA30376.1 heat shock protein Hsp15 [Consotaella salsifontis]
MAEQRIDKWLFFARVVKSRSLAQKLVQSGVVRVNRDKVDSAARPVRPGDVLTIPLHGHVRVLKVLEPGTRRGPASEAQSLYEDLSPPKPPREAPLTDGFNPGDRAPHKRERRALERLRRPDPEDDLD